MIAIITFTTGVMGSGKTANLIETYNHLVQSGVKCYLGKSTVDTRDVKITSRNGKSLEVDFFIGEGVILDWSFEKGSFVFIDEAQFLSARQVRDIVLYAVQNDVNIEFYGLLTDFRGLLFNGSCAVIETTDFIRTYHCNCKLCNLHTASINARFVGNEIITTGSQIEVGGDETYKAICKKCYLSEVGK